MSACRDVLLTMPQRNTVQLLFASSLNYLKLSAVSLVCYRNVVLQCKITLEHHAQHLDAPASQVCLPALSCSLSCSLCCSVAVCLVPCKLYAARLGRSFKASAA